MLKVLLIQTSSLGDVVHNLPVMTDIRRRFPDARIDWAVEEAYAPLVRLNPSVDGIVTVAIRRWRTRLLGRSTWSEIGAMRRLFRRDQYDAVIDTQGLIKSALLARTARGRHHGYDRASAREGIAARLYDVTHHISRDQHAVVRNRLLVGSALGYRPDAPIMASGRCRRGRRRYAVFCTRAAARTNCGRSNTGSASEGAPGTGCDRHSWARTSANAANWQRD